MNNYNTVSKENLRYTKLNWSETSRDEIICTRNMKKVDRANSWINKILPAAIKSAQSVSDNH